MLEDLLFETLNKYNILYKCELPDRIQSQIRRSFKQLNDAEYYSLIKKYYDSNLFNRAELKGKHDLNKQIFKKSIVNNIVNLEVISSNDFDNLLNDNNNELLGDDIAYDILTDVLRQYFLYDGDKWVSRSKRNIPERHQIGMKEAPKMSVVDIGAPSTTQVPETIEITNDPQVLVEDKKNEVLSLTKDIHNEAESVESYPTSIQTLQSSKVVNEEIEGSSFDIKGKNDSVIELTCQEKVDIFLSDLFLVHDCKFLLIGDVRLTFDAFSSIYDNNEITEAVENFINKNGLVAKQTKRGDNRLQQLLSTDWVVPITSTSKPITKTESVQVEKNERKTVDSYSSIETQKIIKYAGAVLLMFFIYFLIVRPLTDNDYFSDASSALDEPTENVVEEVVVDEAAEPLVTITDISENDILNLQTDTLTISTTNEVDISSPISVSSNRSSSSATNQQPTQSVLGTAKNGKIEVSVSDPIITSEQTESEPQNVPQIGKSLKKSKKNNNSNLTPVVRTYTGNIGLFDIELTLEFTTVNTKCKEQGLMVSGKYFYASKPLSKKWIGGHTCGNEILLNETDGIGAIKATFKGVLDGNGNIKGKYQTENGQKIDFYLK